MSKEYDAEEVKGHKSKESAWVIIDGGVFDVTEFLDDVSVECSISVVLVLTYKLAAAPWWRQNSAKELWKGLKRGLLVSHHAGKSRQNRTLNAAAPLRTYHSEKVFEKQAKKLQIGTGEY